MEPRVKPVLRGVFHEVGFFLVLALSVPLALTAEAGKARLAAIVFSACLAGCFGASALYHRPTWTPVVRSWLARLDHAGIYLLIAGTYTPFGLLVLSKGWAIPVLAIVYTGAAAAIVMKLFWVKSPKVLSAVIGLSLGWVGVVAITQLAKVGATGLTLVLVGGLFYTVGGDRLRAQASRPTTGGARVPRAVPPLHDRGRRAASTSRSRSSCCRAARSSGLLVVRRDGRPVGRDVRVAEVAVRRADRWSAAAAGRPAATRRPAGSAARRPASEPQRPSERDQARGGKRLP